MTSRSVIDHFIRPRAIAVVGASDRMDYGGRMLRNLRDGGFTGPIYPVNPRRPEVQGMKAWPDIREVPDGVDLAVLIVPSGAVAAVIEGCGAKKIPACAVITAGFSERGEDGIRAQQDLVALAHRCGVRFTGPNSLGVANFTEHMFATASSNAWGGGQTPLGHISLIAQSGALSFGPLPARAAERGIGFRAIVSVGNQADLTMAEFIDYFVEEDDETHAIALFMEGLPEGEGQHLLAAARKAHAKGKPILALKVGRSPGAAAVARSHTAALTGDDEVYSGCLRASRIIRVEDLDDLWETGALLTAHRGFTPGGGIGFLSNSGGMNSIFADLCGVHGVAFAPLADATIDGIAGVLAGAGAAGNPADVTGNIARPSLNELIDLFAGDAAVDTVVTGTTSVAPGQRSLDIAGNILAARERTSKPFVVLWTYSTTNGDSATSGIVRLREAGLPVFHEANKCARALGWMRSWHRPLGDPTLATLPEVLAMPAAETQADALRLLDSAGIPVAALHETASVQEAETVARRIGYPLVMKIEASGLRHKTELGGVRVGIADVEALRRNWTELWDATAALGGGRRILLQPQVTGALELLLGGRLDPTFGPVVVLGAGGTAVEIERDLAFRPGALTASDVHDMLGELRIARRFAGVRGGPPSDVAALVDAVQRFGALTTRLAAAGIEIEINPLMLLPAGHGVRAVDGRLTLPHRS